MARRRIQEWSGPRRIGRRIDPAAISSSAGIRPHEAAHTAGAPAEVRVEYVGIVPIGSQHSGWALTVDGIIRRSSKRYKDFLPLSASVDVLDSQGFGPSNFAGPRVRLLLNVRYSGAKATEAKVRAR